MKKHRTRCMLTLGIMNQVNSRKVEHLWLALLLVFLHGKKSKGDIFLSMKKLQVLQFQATIGSCYSSLFSSKRGALVFSK